jgi:hypothetical protein
VIGLVAQRRQRRRRALTPPNSNTSTTTMISTHSHVDKTASLGGAGAAGGDATAAHPSKQLGHGQATSRARIDGRAARARGTPAPRGLPVDPGSRDPCTPRPARRSGLAGRVPGRPRIGPGGAEPFGPCPASPAQPYRPAPLKLTRSGGRPALLGWGNNPSMVVLRRNGRRRGASAEPMVRAFGEARTCAEDSCTARLSRTTPLEAARSTKAGTGRR